MKKFISILLKTGLALLFLLVVLFVATKIIEKKAITYTVHQIQKNVKVPVHIGEFSLSLISNFPTAALKLKNTTVFSDPKLNRANFKQPFADTLLHVGEISLQFNLIELFHRRFVLNKVVFKNGQINFLTDASGQTNYDVIKKSTTNEKPDSSATGDALKIMLNSVELKQISARYINRYKKFEAETHMPHFFVRGEFYKSDYNIETTGQLLLAHLKVSQIDFSPNVPANTELQLAVSNKKLTITKGNIESAGINLNVTGNVEFKPNVNVQIQVTGNHIEIAQLLNMLPHDSPFTSKFKSAGQLQFNTAITGQISNKKSPKITTTFNIRNGSVFYPDKNLNIKQIRLAGHYTNGANRNAETSVLKVDTVSFVTDKSRMQASGLIKNFNHPMADFRTQATLDLAEWWPFFGIDTIQLQSGIVEGRFQLKGTIPTDTAFDIWALSPQLAFSVSQLTMASTHRYIDLENLSCNAVVTKGSGLISNLNGMLYQMPVEGSASINLVGVHPVNGKTSTNVNATLSTNELYVNRLSHFWAPSTRPDSLPPLNYFLIFNVTAQKVYYDKYIASQLSGSLQISPEVMVAKNVSFNTFGGSFKGNVSLTLDDPEKSEFTSEGSIQKVDIQTLFKAFNNFNQSFITDAHLRGKLSTNFMVSFPIPAKGPFPSDKIDFIGDVAITGGELINFEPAKELALFSDIPELNHIVFSEVKNQLQISDGKITIPQMDISTNAMDMSVYGHQYLKGEYEYHVKLLMSDVVRGKSARVKSLQTSYGTIEENPDDYSKLYLVMYSEKGKTKVKLDNKEISKSIKNDFQKGLKETKEAFRKEFGAKSADTVPTPPKNKPTESNQFTIEWDED